MAKRAALVISVGKFDDPALSSFSTRRGSRALADLLAAPDIGAYDVQLVEDPTGQEMRVAIHKFFTSARRDALRTLYISSHGLKDDHGRLFLAATDTWLDLLAATTGVSARFLAETIRDSRCRSIVVILDCTYSGAFQNEVSGLRGPSSGIDPDIGRTGWIVIASAGSAEYAFAPIGPSATGSGSVFTDALIEGLREGTADLNADGVIDPEELFDFLHGKVTAATDQAGHRQTPNKIAALTGKLVFTRAPGGHSEDSVLDDRPSSLRAGTSPEAAPTSEVRTSTAPDTKVDRATDAPARKDHLNRAPLADVLARQLREIRRKDPATSFLVHLDGPWGAGKSTLLNFLEERLRDEFTIVHFDAWRQSRLGLPWWTLMSATRKAVSRERRRLSALWLRIAETGARARRSGAAFILAVIVLVSVIGALAVFILPHVPGNEAVATLAKTVTAVVTAAGALWAGAWVAAKLLLWDSARGARLFEQSTSNPMDQVVAHFDWLLRHSRKPVLLFVDDLDRCQGTYVVDQVAE
ncbi:P-loop NTPase fold protein [Amycolatopsis sp. NPDC049691]|uniref:P-loop NTPase fold protein n=1 Tax=Amycolatopsis sp. NPDC049691 TaxID=3155155 RepID=UPI0034240A4C